MSSLVIRGINAYVWKQFQEDSLIIPASASYLGGFKYTAYEFAPFFPIDDIMAGSEAWDNKTHIVYDSMGKMRSSRRQIYPIKLGQMRYSIKGPIDDVFAWRDFITNVLDREDAAAYDINEYAGKVIPGWNARLHNVNVNQTNWMNMSYKDQPTQRKDFSTDLIISYEYHISNVYNEDGSKNF